MRQVHECEPIFQRFYKPEMEPYEMWVHKGKFALITKECIDGAAMTKEQLLEVAFGIKGRRQG